MTYHNIAYMMKLMKDMREAIKGGYFPKWVQDFMLKQFPKKDYPKWVVDALNKAGKNSLKKLIP